MIRSNDLSPTEIHILGLVAKYGLTATAIAKELGIQHTTVRMHTQNILRKLDCHNLAQAVFKYFVLNKSAARVVVRKVNR